MQFESNVIDTIPSDKSIPGTISLVLWSESDAYEPPSPSSALHSISCAFTAPHQPWQCRRRQQQELLRAELHHWQHRWSGRRSNRPFQRQAHRQSWPSGVQRGQTSCPYLQSCPRPCPWRHLLCRLWRQAWSSPCRQRPSASFRNVRS